METELEITKDSSPEALAQGLTVGYKAVKFIDDTCLGDIEAVEAKLDELGCNDAALINEVGVKEKLTNGMYARILTMPKGSFLTGMLHKNPYIDICIHGDMTIKSYLADGTLEDTARWVGFNICEGKPGRKRVGFAHQETLWITVDRTEVGSVEDALTDIVVPTMAMYKNLLEEKTK